MGLKWLTPRLPSLATPATGLPAGTTVYTGALLAGPGFTAQIWSAPDANSSLQPSLNTTTFRTGSAAGFFNLVNATLPNVAKDATSAVLQVRVWDNVGGTVTDWATAIAQGVVLRGASATFTVANVGGDFNTPPTITGLRSLNVPEHFAFPEPSPLALTGLGAAAVLIFRRRK